MKNFSSIVLLITIYLILAGCESDQDSSLEQEMQNRKGKVPKTNLENQSGQPELKPLTNLTAEQKKLRLEAFGVIKENLVATQSEDTGRVVNTIHEDSPQLRSTREGMLFVFQNYDLVYELEDMQLLSATYNEVKVLCKQTTKSIKGSGFMNTRSIGVHTLRRSKDGKLKIFRSDFIKTEQF
jgi:hypothetical protein